MISSPASTFIAWNPAPRVKSFSVPLLAIETLRVSHQGKKRSWWKVTVVAAQDDLNAQRREFALPRGVGHGDLRCNVLHDELRDPGKNLAVLLPPSRTSAFITANARISTLRAVSTAWS